MRNFCSGMIMVGRISLFGHRKDDRPSNGQGVAFEPGGCAKFRLIPGKDIQIPLGNDERDLRADRGDGIVSVPDRRRHRAGIHRGLPLAVADGSELQIILAHRQQLSEAPFETYSLARSNVGIALLAVKLVDRRTRTVSFLCS